MPELFEAIGLALASLFTLLVLLYAVGDNPLFRLVIHIFIGVAAGYAGAVVLKDVILPQVTRLSVTNLGSFASIGLMFLIFAKVSPKTAALGNPASGFLVGVGAAIAVGGAIQGTIFPQFSNAGDFFGLGFAEGSIVLIGTLTTLIHFNFTARRVPNQIPKRSALIRFASGLGQGFIAVTFGVIFAGVFSAALTALIERAEFIAKLFTLLQ